MQRPRENPEIVAMTRFALDHARQGTIELAPEVVAVPAANYTDPARYRQEVARIFRRLPLMLAPSAELAAPGDFRTLEIAGVPLLLVRGQDRIARCFVNSCTHRGTHVVTEERGNARRFTCNYHGWTFGQRGELIAVASPADFGEVDRSCLGLTELRVAERAGLLFASLDPRCSIDIDAYLGGYDRVLGLFDFGNWHFFSERMLRGPNWKIAYDGYLDFYHVTVLHRNTLGAVMDLSNRVHYHAWGPHQYMIAPEMRASALGDAPESEWDDLELMKGVWTIFPSVSIAGFDGGGRGVMISQLLPGEHVGESWTRQIYLMEKEPPADMVAAAHAQFDMLEVVVRDEDYATGLRQQRALEAGMTKQVLFGRNEGGGQAFHRWVERVLQTDDDELNALFSP